MNLPLQLAAGAVLAVFIAYLAYRARSLNRGGAWAAALLGTVIFGLGGLAWAVLLLTFFISSSALSRMFNGRKRGLNEKFSKGSQRDAGQVFANGGVAGLLALAHAFFPHSVWLWLAFAGSLAAVNADTWATELGVLSRSEPRLITTGVQVERGSSGGISWTGTLAALGGGLLVALLAVALWPFNPALPLSGSLGGLALLALCGLGGSLIDSALGATWQAIYTCPTCKKETERHPYHLCGSPTTQIRGVAWLNNDWVNTACALTGALLALGAGLFLGL